MSRPSVRRRLILSIFASSLAVSPVFFSGFGPLTVSAHAAGTIVKKFSLGSGVTLKTYQFATGPEQVRVLTITQGSGVVDVTPAGSQFGPYVKPSQILSNAKETGTGNGPAIAGTNGDFATNGMPVHLEQTDGEIWSSALSASPRFAVNADGSRAWIGNSGLSMTVDINGTKSTIDHWNAGNPSANGITAFSQVGGSSQPPPGTTSPTASDPVYCEVRLLPTSAEQWADASKSGITRSYAVDGGANTNPCQKTPLNLGSDPGAVILAAKEGGNGATVLNALKKDDPLSLSWKSNGWNGVVDSIGGTPILVNKGANVGPVWKPGKNYVYNYNPRTAIGISAGCADADVTTICKIDIVTVDGRRTGWSAGWRMNQLGNFFAKTLKVDYAMNLDGGGGTVMWVNQDATKFGPCTHAASGGCLVNKPSDGGGERVAVVAMAVLPGPDLGLPKALR